MIGWSSPSKKGLYCQFSDYPSWGRGNPQAVPVGLAQEFGDTNDHPGVHVVSQAEAVAVHNHIHLSGSPSTTAANKKSSSETPAICLLPHG